MTEFFLQILLAAGVAVAAKLLAVISSKRGISPIVLILPLGIVLGPTFFNIFGEPFFPTGMIRDESLNASGLITILMELGLIQLVFSAGALTSFEKPERKMPAAALSGLATFVIPAVIVVVLMIVLGASWSLGLAAAGVLSTVSVAWAANCAQYGDESKTSFQNVALFAFVLGAVTVIVASGMRFEPTYGTAMTLIGIVYFLLKGSLLVGVAVVVGRLYVDKLSGPRRPIQGLIGFVLLFALFYGWAAWSVGQIAALPVAFVFGRLFARSKFEIRDRVIAGVSKPDSWLISIFFLTFGLSVDFRDLQSQPGTFVLLLVVLVAGKIIGAIVGAKITERTAADGIKLAAHCLTIGESGLVLAFFAHGRGILVPEVFAMVIAVITLTTFAGFPMTHIGGRQIKKQEETTSVKKRKVRTTIFRKAI